jgi:protein-tyrosine phosphatase
VHHVVPPFVDIHCHILPGIDDGADSMDEALTMARIASGDGIGTVVATPHQLGNFTANRGDDIRQRVRELQKLLDVHRIPLRVLPGADVRIEDGMIQDIQEGHVLTLGDHRRHVLLELPHELYLPLEPLLQSLSRHRITGILSHPERNQGLLRNREQIGSLVDAGCLMQVTAGSLCGTFGPACQQMAEWMVREGLVHFVATDAHGVRSRRPLMRRAKEKICELVGESAAIDVCCRNPALVAEGEPVPSGKRTVRQAGRNWFGIRKAG